MLLHLISYDTCYTPFRFLARHAALSRYPAIHAATSRYPKAKGAKCDYIGSVNSRLQVLGGGGNTYLGGKFDAFFNVFCILGVFLGGGEFGILGGIPPRR